MFCNQQIHGSLGGSGFSPVNQEGCPWTTTSGVHAPGFWTPRQEGQRAFTAVLARQVIDLEEELDAAMHRCTMKNLLARNLAAEKSDL